MTKKWLAFGLSLALAACGNNAKKAETTTSSATTATAAPTTTTATTTATANVDAADAEWKNLLLGGESETIGKDNASVSIVRPNYALFVKVALDKNMPKSASVYTFERKADKWVKTASEVADNQMAETPQDCWRYEDMNGDNLKDVLLLTETDGRNNNMYKCFLQQATGFVQVKDFETHSNPKFNPKTKLLETEFNHNRGSDKESFKWENLELKSAKK